MTIPVQLGGGIRHLTQIEDWFARGVARVILGTAAIKNPALVKEACRKFPGKIAVGIDAKGGKVAVEGWAETSDVTALDLARKFEDAGAAVIIFTDIDRDGLLQGVNVESTAQLARSISIPVIASGGVSSLADIESLLKVVPTTRSYGGGIIGVISGRGPLRRPARSRRGVEAAERGSVMLKMRVIPRPRREGRPHGQGVNFVNLVDAGDPASRRSSMTRRAPTSFASSTSPHPTRTATRSMTWWRRRRRPASCR